MGRVEAIYLCFFIITHIFSCYNICRFIIIIINYIFIFHCYYYACINKKLI